VVGFVQATWLGVVQHSRERRLDRPGSKQAAAGGGSAGARGCAQQVGLLLGQAGIAVFEQAHLYRPPLAGQGLEAHVQAAPGGDLGWPSPNPASGCSHFKCCRPQAPSNCLSTAAFCRRRVHRLAAQRRGPELGIEVPNSQHCWQSC